MHGLSGFHTMTRFDRDEFVEILWDNIWEEDFGEFEECAGCCCDTWDVPYECDSVMHYALQDMSSNGKNTMSKAMYFISSLLILTCWNSF